MAPTFDPKEESAPVSQRTFPSAQARSVALVAAGGVLGAPARYAISDALPSSGYGFPTATFITNLTGALILGALLEGLARLGPDQGRRRSARLLVGTGMCGAYTTYSTLAVDSDQLLRAHRVGLAVAYALGTVLLGLVATGVGIALAAGYRRGRGFPAVVAMDPDLSDLSGGARGGPSPEHPVSGSSEAPGLGGGAPQGRQGTSGAPAGGEDT